MTTAFIPGFLLGLSLILAIGAQDAFVLRQGLRREHVFARRDHVIFRLLLFAGLRRAAAAPALRQAESLARAGRDHRRHHAGIGYQAGHWKTELVP